MAGSITNSITLNRYAYANGNPVSNVDPFGLSSERGTTIFNRMTYANNNWSNMITNLSNETSALSDSSAPKLGKSKWHFNNMLKNLGLLLEKAFDSTTVPQEMIDSNFEVNSQEFANIINELIEKQNLGIHNLLKYGNSTIKDTGCEVIAVNNLLYLYDMNPSMADIIKLFEENGYLVRDSKKQGEWGANPYELDSILDNYGFKYDKVDLEEITTTGTYIISYWTGSAFKDNDGKDGAAHTVTLTYNEETQQYVAYNVDYNGISYAIPSDYASYYITGYKVYIE